MNCSLVIAGGVTILMTGWWIWNREDRLCRTRIIVLDPVVPDNQPESMDIDAHDIVDQIAGEK